MHQHRSVKGGKRIDYYEIAVRQFQQQILPPGMPPTTVWSYGSCNYPAFTIEAMMRPFFIGPMTL